MSFVLVFVGMASAQSTQPMRIVPPFGVASTQPASAYQRGYLDGQRPPVMQPAATSQPANPVDRTYLIASGGSLSAAITQAQKDHAQWPRFSFASGSTFTGSWLLSKGFAGISIDGGPTFNGCATIQSDASCPGQGAFVAIGLPNVSISNLRIVAQPTVAVPVPPRGVYTNAVSNFRLDHVQFDGFAIGFCSDGGSETSVTNCGFFNQSAPKIGKSQGVFLAGSKNWRVEGNIFFHCGWSAADYVSDKAHNDLLQLNHGIYVNADNGTTDGIIRGNLFVDCASSGINSRVGGVYDWNVYRGNGLAADVVIQGLAGTIASSTFLGPTPASDRAPVYGGGVDGISPQLIVRDSMFFSAAVTPLNAAIHVDWPQSNGLLPAGTTATLSNLRGFWLRPMLQVVNGRSVVQVGNDLRSTLPLQPQPSLEVFYGCDAKDLETVLRSRVGGGSSDAAAILDWSARSFSVMAGN